MSVATEALTIPQPDAEPIPLDNQYGAASRYEAAERLLKGGLFKKRAEVVAPHLLASVAETASNEVPPEEIAEAARTLQVADDLIRLVPSVPIIYRLHCEDAVGITPKDKTEGFRFVDTSDDESSWSHWVTTAPVQRLFTVRTGPDKWEDDDRIEENTHINMYAALRFLVTSDEDAVEKFLHGDIGMRYVASRVIIGQQAVNAFLQAKVREELFNEEGTTDPLRFRDSWALIASGALKRLGGDSPIGKHGDFVHEAGLEVLSDVVAVGAGYEGGILRHTFRSSEDGNIFRRLAGIDFDPLQDAQVVGEKATDRAFSEKGTAKRFNGLIYGDRNQVESHLTEVAGNFMDYILSERAA